MCTDAVSYELAGQSLISDEDLARSFGATMGRDLWRVEHLSL